MSNRSPSRCSDPDHEDTISPSPSGTHLWTEPEANMVSIRRKVDWAVVPTVAVLYMCCFINRTNIGNARLAGLEQDLRMTGHDYNMLLSIFYISYILLDLPSCLLCKWCGAGWYLPGLALGFGSVTVSFAFVQNLQAACAVRFLLGVLEAGVLPGVAYYLSRWYTHTELVFRLALYIVTSPIAGAVGGLLASAILHIEHIGPLTHWRMLFLVEGIVTIGVACISFFTLTDRPQTARWLSPDERQRLLEHLRAQSTHEPDSEDKEIQHGRKTTRHGIVSGLVNPVVLTTSIILLLANITVQSIAFFLPTVVRAIYPRKTSVHLQLLTAPPYLCGCVVVLLTCYGSYRWNRRNLCMTFGAGIAALGYVMLLATTRSTARYAATFVVIAGSYAFGALAQAQSAANVTSDTARLTAMATTVTLGNVGGLIATWAFVPSDGPNYHSGNGLNLSTNVLIVVITVMLEWWMRLDNGRRTGDHQTTPPEPSPETAIAIGLEWQTPTFRWRA